MEPVIANLIACVNCLGFMDDDEYKRDEDAAGSLREILRILRQENSEFNVRQALGEVGMVVSDLVPMVKFYHHEESIFDMCMRLLMSLTQPVLILFKQEVPQDRHSLSLYLKLEGYLQSYKKAFADVKLLTVLAEKVKKLVEKEWEDRSESDRLLMERILIVMRNILHVPSDTHAELVSDISPQDQVLWAMHSSGWLDLLLFLGNSEEERQSFVFHAMEIVCLVCREQNPEVLAKTKENEGKTFNENLQRARIRAEQHKVESRKLATGRSTRFSGSYVLPTVRTMTQQAHPYFRDPTKSDVISLDELKSSHRKAKNRQHVKEETDTHESPLSIRLFMKTFCSHFLQLCYNPMMRTAKSLLARNQMQPDDETYYLWCLRFFNAFLRHFSAAEKQLFKPEYVSETTNVATFHWVYEQVMTYSEQMRLDKKRMAMWSRRLHLGVGAYNELFHCLNQMSLPKMSQESRHAASILKANLFYLVEFRELYPLLMRSYNPTRQSQAFLTDLIEGAHLLIKMLEQESKNGLLVVKKKGKAKKKKSRKQTIKASKSGAKEIPESTKFTPEKLEEVWCAMSDDLSAAIDGQIALPDDEELPELFNPLEADKTEDMQRRGLVHIREALHAGQPLKALSLLRIAKLLWPLDENFNGEDEFMALRIIHMREPEAVPTMDGNVEEENGVDEEANLLPGEEADAEEVWDDEEADLAEQLDSSMNEVAFDMKTYIMRFAQPEIIYAYMLLLQEYATNRTYTNHCIVRLFHRLAVDYRMPALLFQLRLVLIFFEFSRDPLAALADFQELRNFMFFYLRRLFEIAQRQKLVFVEMLFYKTPKEAMAIQNGYEDEEKEKESQWSEELDEELQRLVAEYNQGMQQLPQGQDLADWVLGNLTSKDKTRRQVIYRMTHLGLISSAKELKHGRGTRGAPMAEWSEEEEARLRQMVDTFREHPCPIDEIMKGLLLPRSKRIVIKKILSLGLVSSASQLRGKKSAAKVSKKQRRIRANSSDDDQSGSDNEEKRTKEVANRIVSSEFVHSSDESSDSSSSDPDDVHHNLFAELLKKNEEANKENNRLLKGPQLSFLRGDESDISDTFSDSVEATPASPRTPKKKKKDKKKKTKNTPSRDNKRPQEGGMQLSKLPAILKGMSNNCSSWLLEQLRSALEDRLSGTQEAIPLVTFTDEEVDFHRDSEAALRILGVREPNPQLGERYWRFTEDLGVEQLRASVLVLERKLSGDLEEEQVATPRNGNDEDKSATDQQEDEVTPKRKKSVSRRKKAPSSSVSEDSSDVSSASSDESLKIQKPKKKPVRTARKSRVSIPADVDSSDEVESAADVDLNRTSGIETAEAPASEDQENIPPPVSSVGRQKKRLLHVSTSSSSDGDMRAPTEKSVNSPSLDVQTLSGKVGQVMKKRRLAIVDSDDD